MIPRDLYYVDFDSLLQTTSSSIPHSLNNPSGKTGSVHFFVTNMASQTVAAGNSDLHNFRVPTIVRPLHNSIPSELLPRYDPIYVAYYNAFNAGRLHTHEIPIEEFRKNPARYTISYGRAPGPDIFRITEQKCPVDGGEITIRIFEPVPRLDDQGQPKKRAAYVNFHGGGWVFGGLAYDHDFCKRVVHGLDGDLVAFDVDYRLAPEHKYPIPVNDCWTAFNWVGISQAKTLENQVLTRQRLDSLPQSD